MTNSRARSLFSFRPRLPRIGFDWFGLSLFMLATMPMFPASAQSVHAVEIECLALTIYFEARGEPDRGKAAVGNVVMNRVLDPDFPDSVCAVVKQGGETPLYRCQFTWWCDGLSDEPRDLISWQESYWIAHLTYWGLLDDPTQKALWYHADHVHPPWKKALVEGPTIGRHIFYNRVEEPDDPTDRAAPLLASSQD